VRVIDMTRVLAGPFCTMSLGDMGAEVIKVEEPGKGDDTRGWPPFVHGEATYFLSVNRNKKSLTLDLKAPDGQEILRRLLASADVVVENFRPGTMERLGFGYETLERANPRLIYCSISGFGESGPEAHRPGYDLIVQGESGVMDITGFPDGPPVKVGNSIGDLVAGMAAAQGITLALLSRSQTGKGQKVEIGMLDVMASLLTYQAGLYWNAGGRPARRGNEHPSIVPYEVFKAQDVYITLGVANNSLWDRTCKALDRPDLIKDPRFDTEANRVTNRKVLVPLLNEILGARPADEWLARLDKAGVPAGRIKSVAEVCESAHLRARHDGLARASEGGLDPGDGRAGAPARHPGRGAGRAAAPRSAHRRGAHEAPAHAQGARREAARRRRGLRAGRRWGRSVSRSARRRAAPRP
jgi:crotonobetainyl-CoA:carnitine CoA-transferase CaiB-like acyl-CoA transferase